MRSAFLLLIVIVSPFILTAQRNFQPATITRANGVLEQGFVDNREWSSNPKKISFRKTADDAIAELGISDISAFEINGQYKYIKAIVVKDVRPVAIEDLDGFPEESTATDTVFLKELFTNGSITLFLLHDFKDHFYIKEGAGDFVELKYSLKYDRATSSYARNNAFQNQLLNYFPEKKEDPQFISYLEGLKYDEKDILGFFYRVTKTTPKATQKNRPVFFVGTGAQISKFKVSGNTPIADESYNTSVSPLFFAGVEFSSSSNLKDFAIRIQAEFNSLDYKGHFTRTSFPNTVEDESYVLKISNIRLSTALLYSFLRNASSRAYVGVEAFANSSSYKDNTFKRVNTTTSATTVIDDYYSYEKTWIGVNANAGYVFRKKFDISVNYKLAGSFSRMVGIGISPSIASIKLAYIF